MANHTIEDLLKEMEKDKNQAKSQTGQDGEKAVKNHPTHKALVVKGAKEAEAKGKGEPAPQQQGQPQAQASPEALGRVADMVDKITSMKNNKKFMRALAIYSAQKYVIGVASIPNMPVDVSEKRVLKVAELFTAYIEQE